MGASSSEAAPTTWFQVDAAVGTAFTGQPVDLRVRARDDAGNVDAVENALFVNDPALMAECRPAAERLLAAADTSALSLPAALDALLGAVEDRVPAGRQVVEESRRR